MIGHTQHFTDDAGQCHPVAAGLVRIASLVPSITELLFDLQLGEQLVARTDFCRHPAAEVAAVASVGGTKTVDLAALAALRPSHVIVNVDETPRPVFEQLTAAGYTVVVTHPVRVDDNLRLYQLLGGIFDRTAMAAALAERLVHALAETTAAAAKLPHRRVLYLIWRKPWMSIGPTTYIADALARVNWRTEPADTDQRYPTIELNEPLLAGVELVLFASEPFPFGDKHMDAFRAAFPAHAAKAVAIDGEMTSWYGSRAIAGTQYLLRLAHSLAAPGDG